MYILIHVKTSLREQTACCHGSSCFELQHTVIVLQDSPERILGPDLLKSPKLAGRAEPIVRYSALDYLSYLSGLHVARHPKQSSRLRRCRQR